MMERKIKQSKIFLLAILFAVGILAAWVLTFSPASAHAASGIEWGNGGTVEGRTITIDNSESYGVMATAGDKEYAYNVFDFDMTLDLKADDGYAMFELRVAGGEVFESKCMRLCLCCGQEIYLREKTYRFPRPCSSSKIPKKSGMFALR